MGKEKPSPLQEFQCRADCRPCWPPVIRRRKIAPVKGLAVSGAILFALLAGGPARADSIDGTWCSPDGRVLSIAGPEIVTPGRHKVAGNYSRHAFSYVVPDGEDPAGETVDMLLLNEDAVEVKAPDREIETWRRCQVIS
jgi:hypothetical protein